MKYPCVRQHSQEDCGAACLATILLYYGFGVSLNRVREIVGTGSRGTTLLGLRRGAEVLGFNTRQAKADLKLLDRLDKVSLPIIIHWKGNHWVALYGKKFKKYVIADPGVGIRYLTRKELLKGWANGLLLQLTPDKSRFYQQQSDKKKGFGQYLQRVLPYRGILTQAIAMNIAIGLLSLTSPLMMQVLTDDVLVGGDTQWLSTVAIAVIIMKLVQSTISLVQSHLIGHFGQRLQLDLIFDYGRKLLSLPLSYFEARRSGEVVSRIKDVNSINSLVSEIVLGLPSQFFIAIVSLSFMLFYSWTLTLASVIGFLLITAINFLFLPAIRQRTRNKIVSSTENQGFLVETFRGVQVLKTTQATPQAWQEYQRNYNRLANLGWKTMTLSLYSNTITDIFSTVNSISLLWFGSYLVINGTLTIGQLLAFQGMSSNFLGFLNSGVSLIDKFVNAQIVIQRLTEVIEATPEDESDFKKPNVKIPCDTDIVCSHLNFYHPGRLNLLKDFSVTIPGGKVTALIGKSGCGKSTVAKLITSLDKVKSGNISYGLYNQQDLSLECLRQQVILVPQETHFWSRSIIENFCFSYPDISFENIVQACQIAGADEFINRLPDKYQTVLGEFGANLSGGQRQRLAIARAIVTDPPILILDESTGALDPVSEAQVLDRILDYRQGKTTIIISHRPKVIERADWIVMLEQGNLRIKGKVEELRKIKGEHSDFLF
ncbi:bacteriocin-processing peptidase [Rivularia sp. PCC 7116]|uniref:peptidase domain-containing ABC transporter n=1 Tax=Rivularia sp. PCC 7116 TaxID=373994 RepID=UPI00029ED37B|nr:peptidase domain-containing ABC transporter [Rivularia sp. PCC 7116]AFY57404.1 bacteriocin-processing peptidase [Rivularia sp. PCC 7116]